MGRFRAHARAAAAATAALTVGLSAGCRDSAGPSWPPGASVVASAEAARTLLRRAAALEGTPLARLARELDARLPDCPTVEAHADSGAAADLEAGLRCGDPHGPLAAGHRALDGADVAFALPAGEAGPLLGRFRLDAGDLRGELQLPSPPAQGALALLVPGREPAGPGVLDRGGALVHARVRPAGGLDLGALVPERSQADVLFRLRSELFSGVVLDGTWEAGVYLPEPGHGMPRVALALGFSLRDPAIAAAERLLADLRETWPVQRSAFALGDLRGACLLELNVLPDLAPCYVTTDRALVFGWNADSLRAALGTRARASLRGAPARLDLDLALFAEADAILGRHLPAAERPPSLHWPWSRLVAEGEQGAGGLLLRVALREGSGR